MTPQGLSRRRRLGAIIANGLADTYGHLELVPGLQILSRYPVRSYVYDITPELSRGNRVKTSKVAALHAEGFGATVNLCAEMPQGDRPAIAAAGLSMDVMTFQHPIVDMNPPTVAQVVAILDTLVDLRDQGIRTHVNCQAGKSRAGVVIACFRMAAMGWSADDALAEAKNFGNCIPMQQTFLETFGAMLVERWQARQAGDDRHRMLGHYPLLRPGSVKATPVQLTATLKQAARMSKSRLLAG